jgi:hypothetical protein
MWLAGEKRESEEEEREREIACPFSEMLCLALSPSHLTHVSMSLSQLFSFFFNLSVDHIYTYIYVCVGLWHLFFVFINNISWWMVGDYDENSWSSYVEIRDTSAPRQYLYSLYWVITTMTTVGYGDITAQNDTERAFSMFAMVTTTKIITLKTIKNKT